MHVLVRADLYQRINILKGADAVLMLNEHWRQFRRLWKQFINVAEAALAKGCTIVIQWPRECADWRQPCVQRFFGNRVSPMLYLMVACTDSCPDDL